jgi:hypothetical protein
LKDIFKIHALKIKYEAVESLYKSLNIKDSIIHNKQHFPHISKSIWNIYFEAIRGFPPDDFEDQTEIIERMSTEERNSNTEHSRDSISQMKLVSVKRLSEEEIKGYIKQLNCTPAEALKEYLDFIQHIKSEKEVYMKCIDAEISKDDLSEYASIEITPLYSFFPPWESLTPLPWNLTKLNYLKIFKEFIFNDNNDVLPDGLRVYAYLKCNCKIP